MLCQTYNVSFMNLLFPIPANYKLLDTYTHIRQAAQVIKFLTVQVIAIINYPFILHPLFFEYFCFQTL